MFVLIAAAAIFALRLYLVESRVNKQWRDCEEFLFLCKSACDEAVTPDEAWWRAEQEVIDSGVERLKRRRNTLRKVVRTLTVAALAACALLIAGALSAATATGSMAVSAMVLTRCVVRFPVRGNDADSSCGEGVTPTRSVQTVQLDQPEAPVAVAPEIPAPEPSAARTRIVTLAY